MLQRFNGLNHWSLIRCLHVRHLALGGIPLAFWSKALPNLKINFLCFSSHRESHMARLIN